MSTFLLKPQVSHMNVIIFISHNLQLVPKIIVYYCLITFTINCRLTVPPRAFSTKYGPPHCKTKQWPFVDVLFFVNSIKMCSPWIFWLYAYTSIEMTKCFISEYNFLHKVAINLIVFQYSAQLTKSQPYLWSLCFNKSHRHALYKYCKLKVSIFVIDRLLRLRTGLFVHLTLSSFLKYINQFLKFYMWWTVIVSKV